MSGNGHASHVWQGGFITPRSQPFSHDNKRGAPLCRRGALFVWNEIVFLVTYGGNSRVVTVFQRRFSRKAPGKRGSNDGEKERKGLKKGDSKKFFRKRSGT